MANANKHNFSSGLIIGIIGAFVIVGLAFGLLVATNSTFSDIFPFKSNKVGVIEIVGEIGAGSSILSPGPDIGQIISDLEEIDNDPFYAGVLIKIDSPGGTVVGSRSIVETLKEMKKPSVCWLGDTAASGAYWIASACDKIVADPLTLTGSVGATASYLQYTGLFEKYGVKYEQIVSGESKDIGSPYKNLTKDDREKLQYIVDESFRYFLEDVKQNRKLTSQQVEKIKTGDMFLGKDALEIGLVDKLGTLKDVRGLFKELLGTNPNFVLLKRKQSLFG